MKTLFVLWLTEFLLNAAWKIIVVAVAFSYSTALGWTSLGILVAQLVTTFLRDRQLDKLETQAMSTFVDDYLKKAIGGGTA